MYEYYEEEIVPRKIAEESNFNAVSLARADMEEHMVNQARKDERNLPGETFFHIKYMADATGFDGSDEDRQVDADDTWDYILITGRLVIDE